MSQAFIQCHYARLGPQHSSRGQRWRKWNKHSSSGTNFQHLSLCAYNYYQSLYFSVNTNITTRHTVWGENEKQTESLRPTENMAIKDKNHFI